ncbi:MAG: MATE family efflux transporter, partial [Novosphingobium sp.]|nr:MATE family efflux transporter [Novosphingobium sp.]
MIITVLLDVCFNPLLIRGFGPIPALGIAGSALSTALANVAGVSFMIWRVYGHDLPLRLRGHELGYLWPSGRDLGYVIGKGLPMGAQMLVMSAAGLIMIGLVNHEGMIAAAAYGASLQLWNYLQMPAFAIGSAVSAMVAQNIGAGHHERVGKITAVGLWTNLWLTGSLAAVLVLLSHPLAALFLGGHSPAVPLTSRIQVLCTWSFVMSGVMMILGGTMRAYGAVLVPLVVLIISMYPARLGFYFLAYPQMGIDAVWLAQPAGSIASMILTLIAYFSGYWRPKLEAPAAAAQPA